ncbi:MAG: glycosyltransferase family 4 protein [Gemmatimonadales bacterium]
MAIPRLVYVLSDQAGMVGGAAKATLLLCEALRRAGSGVTLFSTFPTDNLTRDRLENAGIRIHSALLSRGSRFGIPAKSIAVQLWVAARMKRPGAVHAVGLTGEASHLLTLPFIPPTFVWETTEAKPLNKFVDRRIAERLARCAALLVPSKTMEENVRATYAFAGSTRILPFWTEDRAPGGNTASTGKRSRALLFVGRMDPDKGFRYLLPAFENVRRQIGDVTLAICGGGSADGIPELRNPPDGVEVRGTVSGEELDERLSACAAVVLPSLHEGYPLSLLEACSFGKPVIATTVGSIPELFSERRCAILVPPSDTTALEKAIATILTEPQQVYAERCADARMLYEKVSSPEVVLEALSRAYGGV